jgi:hypothetical protein
MRLQEHRLEVLDGALLLLLGEECDRLAEDLLRLSLAAGDDVAPRSPLSADGVADDGALGVESWLAVMWLVARVAPGQVLIAVRCRSGSAAYSSSAFTCGTRSR